jgi:uncharacterized protein
VVIMTESTKNNPAVQALTVLAFSDLHGKFGVVKEALRHVGHADLLLIAGDLTTNGSRTEGEEALRILGKEGRPLLVVAGNMDPPSLDGLFLERGLTLNARGVTVGDVGFHGVSGGPLSPLNTPNELAEEEILLRAEQGWQEVRGARTRVFVPHAPPSRTKLDRIWSGQHVGSTAVRRFIEERAPDLCVCGHIHESRGVDRIGPTTVVNCGAGGKGHYALLRYDGRWSVDLG